MPLNFTNPGTPKADELLAAGKETLPPVFFSEEREEELICALAGVLARACVQVDDWVRMGYITTADGKWLIEHGRDRKIFPVSGESEDSFRDRIRNPADVVSPVAIDAEVQRQLDIAGVVGSFASVELPCDAAFSGSSSDSTGDADNFSFSDSTTNSPNGNAYRSGAAKGGGFVYQLPVGTSQVVADAISEAIRTVRARGFIHSVEISV